MKHTKYIAVPLLVFALWGTSPAKAQQNSAGAPGQSPAAAPSAGSSSPSDIFALDAASSLDDDLKAGEKDFDDEAQAADAKLNPPPAKNVPQSDSQRNATEAKVAQPGNSAQTDDPPALEKSSKASTQRSALAQDLFVRLGADLSQPVKGGIPVCAVRPGTPAASAGLQAGDVINDLNGQKVRSLKELRSGLRGQMVTLGIVRHRLTKTIHVDLENPATSNSAISSGRAE